MSDKQESAPAAEQGEYKAVHENAEMPAHVRYVFYDDKKRRCTAFVCECNSATRDRNSDAETIARLLNQKRPSPALDTKCPKCGNIITPVRECWACHAKTTAAEQLLDWRPIEVVYMMSRIERENTERLKLDLLARGLDSDAVAAKIEQRIVEHFRDNPLPCPFPSCVSKFARADKGTSMRCEEQAGGFIAECQDCCSGTGSFHSREAALDEWNKLCILVRRGLSAPSPAQERPDDDTLKRYDRAYVILHAAMGRPAPLELDEIAQRVVDRLNVALAAQEKPVEASVEEIALQQTADAFTVHANTIRRWSTKDRDTIYISRGELRERFEAVIRAALASASSPSVEK